MADFCTNCSQQLFGEEVKPDINIDEIIESLEPGYAVSVLCEGCSLSAIQRKEDGGIWFGYLDYNKEHREFEWETELRIEEL